MGLIAKDKTVKTPRRKFDRLFEVQHYCRLLHQRHAAALKRKMQHVNAALASFLGTTSSTIKHDLAFSALIFVLERMQKEHSALDTQAVPQFRR